MFLSTVCWLRPKNSLPSTRICRTSFPLCVILPSSSMTMPGSFLMSSSTIEPGGTVKAAALYITVSSTTVISGSLPSTTASAIIVASSRRRMSCTRLLPLLPLRLSWNVCALKPMNDTFTVYFPAGTPGMRNKPFSCVCLPATILPVESLTATLAPGNGFSVELS